MSDTYDVTLRFECDDPSVAAAVVHELIMVLNPAPDGTALVTNPRIWSVEAVSVERGIVVSDSREFDLAFRCASTLTRDRAYRFVHSACRGVGVNVADTT